MATSYRELPIPPFYNEKEMEVSTALPYLQVEKDGETWAKQQHILPSAADRTKIALLAIDEQRTFCVPEGELFVAGASGRAAMDDSDRLARFIYSNLGIITAIYPTLDTHTQHQIFSRRYWVDSTGNHPEPFTEISVADVESQRWTVNPAMAGILANGNLPWLQKHALHYVKELSRDNKFALTIWPPHGRLGGQNHALVTGLERAFNVHSAARAIDVLYQVKGGNPFTENYSALNPEVVSAPPPVQTIAQKNVKFIEQLLTYNIVIITGQAASHCVAWTIDDLLNEILKMDPKLARKVYILKDCTSPIVIPGVKDWTPETDAAFRRFQNEQMNLVESTTPITDWPGVRF